MTTIGKKFSEVLKKFSTLEWYRFSTGEGVGVDCPLNVWRFDFQKTDHGWADQIISTLHSILKNFKGNVEWTLEKPEFSIEGRPGRNWVLIPTRFKEMDESGRFNSFLEARSQLYEDDRDFGPKAYEDLAKIAKSLDERLSALKKSHNAKDNKRIGEIQM